MEQINYEEEHRKLWSWLADNPESIKYDYFKNWDYGSIPHRKCFACEAALQEANRMGTYHICGFCPLGGERIMGCRGGLYAEWCAAVSLERRQQLARQIANLPWKEKENEYFIYAVGKKNFIK